MPFIKSSFFILVILLVCTGLAELGSFLIWKYNLSSSHHGGVFQVKRIIGDTSIDKLQTIVSNPYSLYWNNPDYQDEFGYQFDRNGYRLNDYTPAKEEIRVLVLGGSTTNAYPYVKNRNKIWTSQLQGFLSHWLKKPVHVFNAGLPYGTSAELLVHFLLKGRYLKPHIVIFHEGGNDVAPLLFPGYKTDYSHFRASTTAGYKRLGERTLLKHSYLARVVYSIWMSETGIYQHQPYSFSQVSRSEALKMVETNDSPAFKSNVEVITREAASLGALVLLVGFLQADKNIIGRNRPDLLGLEEALIAGVEKHDNIMKAIADNLGEHFFKLDRIRFKQNWFLDNCHLNEEGEEEKAKQIFHALQQVLKNQTLQKISSLSRDNSSF